MSPSLVAFVTTRLVNVIQDIYGSRAELREVSEFGS